MFDKIQNTPVQHIKALYRLSSIFSMLNYLLNVNINPLSVNPTRWSNTLKQSMF